MPRSFSECSKVKNLTETPRLVWLFFQPSNMLLCHTHCQDILKSKTNVKDKSAFGCFLFQTWVKLQHDAEATQATSDPSMVLNLPAPHCWGSSCFGQARSAVLWWGPGTACSPAGRTSPDCPPASWIVWPTPLDERICLLTGERSRGVVGVQGCGPAWPWWSDSWTVRV